MLIGENLDIIVSDIIKYRRVQIDISMEASRANRLKIPRTSQFYCECVEISKGTYDITQIEDGETYTWNGVGREVLENMVKSYTELEMQHGESTYNLIGALLGETEGTYKEEEQNDIQQKTESANSCEKRTVTAKEPSKVELPERQSEEIERLKIAMLRAAQDTEKSVEIKVKPKVGPGCVRCKFTGWITVDEVSGFSVKCDCQVREENRAKVEKVVIASSIKDREKLRGLIPLERRKDEYDSEVVKNRIKEISATQNCRIYNFDNFDSLLNTILSEVATGTLKHSYILGAPNGFGKTTFVYTAIKRIVAREGKAVPYISLSELAVKKVEYEARLVEKLKHPRFDEHLKDDMEYTWADYMNADVLFTYLSSIDSKTLESMILSAIVSLRGTKGLPTIVMTAYSINPYKNDTKLRQYYWDEMLDYGGKLVDVGCDRLIHKSCFKLYDNPMQVVKGVDY